MFATANIVTVILPPIKGWLLNWSRGGDVSLRSGVNKVLLSRDSARIAKTIVLTMQR